MADVTFEGDINVFSEVQIKFLRDTLDKLGYKDNNVVIEAVGKLGDNFAAQVKRLVVKTRDGNDFSMIVKVAPVNEVLRNMMNAVILFNNEHIMYTKILPKYTEMQKAAGIPEKEQLRLPQCYGTFMEAPNEIIALEDLKKFNYTMLNKFEPLLDDCVKNTLKTFAKFHALSYVLKKEDHEEFDSVKNSLMSVFELMDAIEKMNIYFDQLEDDVIQIMDSGKYKKALKGNISRMTKNLKKFSKEDAESKYSVIQHGDSWTNNIMFIMKDGVPIESILIDFQLCKETSPVADLSYFFFNCTDYKSRAKHFTEWLDYYYSELDDFLSFFSIKANFVYPRDKLDADFRRYGKISLALTVLLASVLTRESSEVTDIYGKQETNEVVEEMMAQRITDMKESSLKRFKEKVEGTIDSLFELGLM